MVRNRVGELVLAAAVLLVTTGGAQATTCRQDAQAADKACKASCASDFLDAKAGCLNVNPGCLQACIDGRDECVDTASMPLTTCLATCDPPLDSQKAMCRSQCMCGGSNEPACAFNACFLGCVTPAETVAFECRNQCRDAFRLNSSAQSALMACATGYRDCVHNCQTPAPQ